MVPRDRDAATRTSRGPIRAAAPKRAPQWHRGVPPVIGAQECRYAPSAPAILNGGEWYYPVNEVGSEMALIGARIEPHFHSDPEHREGRNPLTHAADFLGLSRTPHGSGIPRAQKCPRNDSEGEFARPHPRLRSFCAICVICGQRFLGQRNALGTTLKLRAPNKTRSSSFRAFASFGLSQLLLRVPAGKAPGAVEAGLA
jgi:hypothetical protein